MRLQSRTRATARTRTPTGTSVGTHIGSTWHPRGDTARKPRRDPCAPSLCTCKAGSCAGPPDDRRGDSGVRTDLSAAERTGWSPNGEPSWRRAASELPDPGCGGGGREPSGAARPGPACRAVEAEGMAPAAPDGEGRGGNAGPEVARGGCGAGVCPSARTPGKGTVSAGIGGKVCVDPAEGERRPQPGYRLDCAVAIAFLHPCSPLEDIRCSY